MNDNLRVLHCVVCLARIQAGDSLDTVRSRPTSLYEITLVMI